MSAPRKTPRRASARQVKPTFKVLDTVNPPMLEDGIELLTDASPSKKKAKRKAVSADSDNESESVSGFRANSPPFDAVNIPTSPAKTTTATLESPKTPSPQKGQKRRTRASSDVDVDTTMTGATPKKLRPSSSKLTRTTVAVDDFMEISPNPTRDSMRRGKGAVVNSDDDVSMESPSKDNKVLTSSRHLLEEREESDHSLVADSDDEQKMRTLFGGDRIPALDLTAEESDTHSGTKDKDAGEDKYHDPSRSVTPFASTGGDDIENPEENLTECPVSGETQLNATPEVCPKLRPTYANAPPLPAWVDANFNIYNEEPQTLTVYPFYKALQSKHSKLESALLKALIKYLTMPAYGANWFNPARQDYKRWEVAAGDRIPCPNDRQSRAGFVIHGFSPREQHPGKKFPGTPESNEKKGVLLVPMTVEWSRCLSFFGYLLGVESILVPTFDRALSITTWQFNPNSEKKPFARAKSAMDAPFATTSPTRAKQGGTSRVMFQGPAKLYSSSSDPQSPIPVFDARAFFQPGQKGKRRPLDELNFDALAQLPSWNGEIPELALISVLCSAGKYKDPPSLGLNVYGVVVLMT